jgi:von Willebrand factor type A domain-containing protein
MVPPPGPGHAGTGGRSSSSEQPDASAGGTAFAGAANCGDVICRGPGKCQGVGDDIACVCDAGYVLVGDECVVDESCIKLRLLERTCRQRTDKEPALAMFFNMETCAGTTVPARAVGDITRAFKVLEDDEDLGEESFATVFDRGVESYVAIALDMSSSVANDAHLLDSLIPAVKKLVDDLGSATPDGSVQIELIVFGRSVQTELEFTSDLQAVKDKLDDIRANSQTVLTDPGGTNLNGVVNAGMSSLVEALDRRLAASGGSVLATGTLVTITDGKDTAGVKLLKLVPRLNYISIGVSNQIDDKELTTVGAQGSFLAPEPADWVSAFSTVAQRVAEYPSRAHLLAYCSPAVAGKHKVVATLANGEAAATASCNFDATKFGVGSGVCTESFINGYCPGGTHGCGTFLACGACGATTDAGASDDVWIESEVIRDF